MADDLLRRAVDRLRASRDALPDDFRGAWGLLPGSEYVVPVSNPARYVVAHANFAAEHIALTASPHVTDAQIAWLEAILAESASLAEHDGFDPWVTIAGYAEAVAYARAVLREQP